MKGYLLLKALAIAFMFAESNPASALSFPSFFARAKISSRRIARPLLQTRMVRAKREAETRGFVFEIDRDDARSAEREHHVLLAVFSCRVPFAGIDHHA